VNFALDSLALLVLLAVLWTRIVAFWIVPAPRAGVAPLGLWGLTHAGWDAVNFWLTMGFAVVILLHLIMHWTWIAQFVHQRVQRRTGLRTVLHSGTQTIYGVGFMIVIFMVTGGMLAVAAIVARPMP